jgi:acyl carrier protein
MTPDRAREAIRAALREVAPDVDFDTVPLNGELRDAVGLDSLDFLRLVELLSESTGVRIDEEDYPKLATLRSGIDWLASAVPIG